jgi:hypothetical protein
MNVPYHYELLLIGDSPDAVCVSVDEERYAKTHCAHLCGNIFKFLKNILKVEIYVFKLRKFRILGCQCKFSLPTNRTTKTSPSATNENNVFQLCQNECVPFSSTVGLTIITPNITNINDSTRWLKTNVRYSFHFNFKQFVCFGYTYAATFVVYLVLTYDLAEIFSKAYCDWMMPQQMILQ